ncbi:hypothetical protein EDEG_02534 [Edhazardia aedis USNM 41457]|uniref:Uncharacterized protein n=1 Tax=Edhazardia aedis (strain USNM 41457) TaxID=1003232 RepID=J9DP13_EDHAE|nr:hypothetical protein EDEG_02534 [Edhazardia aedis USNM 41457]|eukprot:EJW03082.1 hypothetical protein EDEG_02534 [Edhazardia aedis USNM 41457]
MIRKDNANKQNIGGGCASESESDFSFVLKPPLVSMVIEGQSNKNNKLINNKNSNNINNNNIYNINKVKNSKVKPDNHDKLKSVLREKQFIFNKNLIDRKKLSNKKNEDLRKRNNKISKKPDNIKETKELPKITNKINNEDKETKNIEN